MNRPIPHFPGRTGKPSSKHPGAAIRQCLLALLCATLGVAAYGQMPPIIIQTPPPMPTPLPTIPPMPSPLNPVPLPTAPVAVPVPTAPPAVPATTPAN